MKSALLNYVLLQPLSVAGPLRGMPARFVESLVCIVEQNLGDSLSVGFLAVQLGVSKSTLNRKLLHFTGLPANKIIRLYRLQKAVSLLHAGKNVSEAAYLSGFETPSYFIRCFKEYYHVTPKKYSQSKLSTLQQ